MSKLDVAATFLLAVCCAGYMLAGALLLRRTRRAGLALFAIGFLLFGPDSLIVATAAVDFGTKKGASSAVGLINGFGSIGAVLGGSLPGIISERYGWDVLFYILGAAVLIAGLLLVPKWNAVPTRN